MCDTGHYAAPSIRLQASKLDRDWQTFAAALEERSTILTLSVVFHKKANEVNDAVGLSRVESIVNIAVVVTVNFQLINC